MSTTFPSMARRLAAVGALVVVATSCTGVKRVTEYGPEAKANFVDACTTDRKVEGGEVIETKLASRSSCECVYVAIRDEFRLSFDALAEYEAEVDGAKAGEAPAMPSQLEKAIKKCSSAGPSVPSTTTTTESP